MRHSRELSRSERRHPAGGLGGTGTVAHCRGGGCGGAAAFRRPLTHSADTSGGEFGLGVPAGSVAMMPFFLVGGVGAVLGRGDPGRRIRARAAGHPRRVAAVPVSLTPAGDVVVRRIPASESFLHSLWDGIRRAAVVAAVVGVAGSVTGSSGRR